MNQIVLDNLNPIVFEKIQRLAQKHNRSLEDEIKTIIEKVAETEVTSSGSARCAFREKLKTCTSSTR